MAARRRRGDLAVVQQQGSPADSFIPLPARTFPDSRIWLLQAPRGGGSHLGIIGFSLGAFIRFGNIVGSGGSLGFAKGAFCGTGYEFEELIGFKE